MWIYLLDQIGCGLDVLRLDGWYVIAAECVGHAATLIAWSSSTSIRDLQVQVIALRIVITSLLPDASPRAKEELTIAAQNAPDIALGFAFSDEQIEQLRSQLEQIRQSF